MSLHCAVFDSVCRGVCAVAPQWPRCSHPPHVACGLLVHVVKIWCDSMFI